MCVGLITYIHACAGLNPRSVNEWTESQIINLRLGHNVYSEWDMQVIL